MRNIFLVASKLLGLFTIYLAISTIPSMSFLIANKTGFPYSSNWVLSFTLLTYFVLILLFGVILLFRTEKVADILKIKTSPESISKPSSDELLWIGVILIGIYLVASAIPQLAKRIYSATQYSDSLISFVRFQQLLQLLGPVIQIVIGTLLTFSARKVVRIITKRDRKINITSRSS